MSCSRAGRAWQVRWMTYREGGGWFVILKVKVIVATGRARPILFRIYRSVLPYALEMRHMKLRPEGVPIIGLRRESSVSLFRL